MGAGLTNAAAVEMDGREEAILGLAQRLRGGETAPRRLATAEDVERRGGKVDIVSCAQKPMQ